MAMILTLDTMAERYKCLPSEVLARGSTLDLYVMDAALSYHNYQHKKAMGKADDLYSQEELEAIMQKVKDNG